MVGYCANGYRLWCPEDNKIILEWDVIFIESKFTFETGDFYDSPIQQNSTDLERTAEPSNSGRVNEVGEVKRKKKLSQMTVLSKQDFNNLRKSTRVKNRPKYLEDYTVLAESFVEDVPEHFDDIQGREDEEQWLRAVNEEMTSLIENKT